MLLIPPSAAKTILRALALSVTKHQPTPTPHPLLPCLLQAAGTDINSSGSSSSSSGPFTSSSTPQAYVPPSRQAASAHPAPVPRLPHFLLESTTALHYSTSTSASADLSTLQPYKKESHPITLKPQAQNPFSRGQCTLEMYRLPGWDLKDNKCVGWSAHACCSPSAPDISRSRLI
jgi:hypothetical protein